MTHIPIEYFALPERIDTARRNIAFRYHPAPPGAPTIVFLPGYMSDMDGGKATATMEWARANKRGCLLLDYSGCGSSDGEFANGTLTQWRDEVLALIAARANSPVVLVGSSMGGWLMLLVARKLGASLHAMVGIAAAPDFSQWGFDDGQKAKLAAGETVFEDNPYGPEPTPTYAKFWQDAQQSLQLGGEIPVDVPMRLLHGQRDADVPWDISLQLAAALRSDDVQVTLVKDGDHRLSRDTDIEALLGIYSAL
ncbi:Mycophenolic acid acyl-glucuronide esterase [Alteripontixanthobacter maritimus]|uniref:Palmitoyl-protein thioesterase ABHD10, mitochondrial n=1 Tax=Alteripontixanthobacter maritimus TaxID=2161824 RepID=A0A369QA88_9SPHN|nr:alpha/beta hydrolase [Alteripontixanthobacter maritimus]RDC61260.1 Mycophenolic acid acyl-glucuronide esterase [Alteripontixanthobacter maritimus]